MINPKNTQRWTIWTRSASSVRPDSTGTASQRQKRSPAVNASTASFTASLKFFNITVAPVTSCPANSGFGATFVGRISASTSWSLQNTSEDPTIRSGGRRATGRSAILRAKKRDRARDSCRRMPTPGRAGTTCRSRRRQGMHARVHTLRARVGPRRRGGGGGGIKRHGPTP